MTVGGGSTGTIFVKGGQVVSAQANPLEGREAFHRLFRGAQGDFFVFRADTPQELAEPLGALSARATRPRSVSFRTRSRG